MKSVIFISAITIRHTSQKWSIRFSCRLRIRKKNVNALLHEYDDERSGEALGTCKGSLLTER